MLNLNKHLASRTGGFLFHIKFVNNLWIAVLLHLTVESSGAFIDYCKKNKKSTNSMGVTLKEEESSNLLVEQAQINIVQSQILGVIRSH